MSLFPKIKRCFTAIPRSYKAIQSILQKLESMEEAQRNLYSRIERADVGINTNIDFKFEKRLMPSLQNQFESLEASLSAHDSHMKLFAWEHYRKANEPMEDAKIRFFRELPSATGAKRLLQLGNAKLLHEFHDLCEKHDISYFLACGTLLGAVRHGGFIPWDDDVDVGMLRGDINRLRSIVADDHRFRITVVFDWYAFCKQVRFRYADPNLPCFIDLFYFDYTRDFTDETCVQQKSLRKNIIVDTRNDAAFKFWKETPYLPPWVKKEAKRLIVFSTKCMKQ